MRRCFIHIGTHNTGTTSIQHLLDRNRVALLRSGYLYPLTGRPDSLPGQHNLAWEVSGDHRFQPAHGTITDLVNELANASEDIILSSEDFECALYNGSAFSDFVSTLQSSGFIVTVILYLRHQVDYLPRIYLTLMHFGLNLPFAEVLNTVMESGKFHWRDWIINFDYSDVLRRATRAGGANCVVRSYTKARTSVCRDFLTNFDLAPGDLDSGDEVFANRSEPLKGYVRMFVQNKTGKNLLDNEDVAINTLSWEAKTIGLSPGVQLKISDKFKESNQDLFSHYGIAENSLRTPPDENLAPDMCVDQLFTESIRVVSVGQ